MIPGFIDASTDIGLNEPGVRNYDDVSEMLPFNQMLRTRVAYQSDSIAIPVARIEGITTVAVSARRRHDQRRNAGDESRRLDVGRSHGASDGRARVELSRARPAAAAAVAVAAGGAAPAAGPDPIEDAEPAARRARVVRETAATRQVDWNLEPFVPVLDRRQALYVPASTEQAIRDAVAWAERQNVRIVLQTGADAQRVAGAAQAARRAGDSHERALAAAA